MDGRFDFFWETVALCDWTQAGDDARVLKPVIDALAGQGDQAIFAFDDLMSELLYRLDTKVLADQCAEVEPLTGDDSFLYSRCVALVNGPAYYEQVRQGRDRQVWDMEFEALLYVPARAWAQKHGQSPEAYPHVPPLSVETSSNRAEWGD